MHFAQEKIKKLPQPFDLQSLEAVFCFFRAVDLSNRAENPAVQGGEDVKKYV
ncbi:hypothetical protein ACBP93_03245 [Paenalcaligenes hominis]|uniref:Uncharacterized protein n=1 Tax=Paenalcaligenes hominis TaxID=643674 RepID=A0ABX0WRW4_9BURK|nr:hypothetical protein [Paenalcaligenes hominis]NJB65486.1 hypothetical protein [Paenalcaligenes hominis]